MCMGSQETTNKGGRERTLRFLQTSQALQTLARATFTGLQCGQMSRMRIKPRLTRRVSSRLDLTLEAESVRTCLPASAQGCCCLETLKGVSRACAARRREACDSFEGGKTQEDEAN